MEFDRDENREPKVYPRGQKIQSVRQATTKNEKNVEKRESKKEKKKRKEQEYKEEQARKKNIKIKELAAKMEELKVKLADFNGLFFKIFGLSKR
jgi:hypothetical protein